MTRTQFYLYASASVSAALAVGLVWYARAASISRRTGGATSAAAGSSSAGGLNGAAAAVGGVAHAAGGVISGVLGWIGLGGGGASGGRA